MPVKPLTLEPSRRVRHASPVFSLEQANDSLVYVRRVVQDAVRLYGQTCRLRRRIESCDAENARPLERDYESLLDQLGQCVDELDLVGVELADFEIGMVDFPAIRRGQRVRLTWRLGARRILSWRYEHETSHRARPIADFRRAAA